MILGPPQLAASFIISDSRRDVAYGTSRHFAVPQNSVAIGGIADIPYGVFYEYVLVGRCDCPGFTAQQKAFSAP